jgi:hypothetical protein
LTRLNKNMRKPIFIILIVLGFILPILAYAALVPCGRCCNTWNEDRTVCDVPCEGVSDEEAQPCTFCDIFRMLQIVINYIWWILLIIAPLFIIAGGIMILTAGVKPDQLDLGKRIITGTVIGIAIAFLSWTILNIVFISLAKTPGGTGEEAGFPWPWNEVRCTGGAVTEQEEISGCRSNNDCDIGETCNLSTGVCEEASVNTYCHLQIANANDQMVYDYDTVQECYTECPSHCVGPGINCEMWCCLGQNLDGGNNVCGGSTTGSNTCTCGENSYLGARTYSSEAECISGCSAYCSNTYSGTFGCCDDHVLTSGCFVSPGTEGWCQRTAPSGSDVWILGGINSGQRGDANVSLINFINCMYIEVIRVYGSTNNLTITSISDDGLCASPQTCNPATGAGCAHTAGSCHYGGPSTSSCFGASSAVDFRANATTCAWLAQTARYCGGSTAWINWETNPEHLHVSLNNATCSCNESGTPTPCP